MVWIFSPMFVEIGLIFKERETRKPKNLFVGFIKNLPIMMPVRNIYLCCQLIKIKYSNPMKANEQKKLESIKMKGGQRSLTEAFAVSFKNP